MGWRSWNLFADRVNQSLMEQIMDGMVSRKRTVDGVQTSLCDLGYCDVGLDDNWQVCGSGQTYEFHDDAGIPKVNEKTFPDFIGMTSKAHGLGLTAGWYGNNCICAEKHTATTAMYQGDVAALTLFGFDAIKLDGCGTQRDLDLYAKLINATGRRVMIENCHWGGTVPNATWCPWNFFRSSADIQPNYGSVIKNLLTTVHWAKAGLSKPGCWAYPDMLEVGVPGLSHAEARSHFGAWCITSSPLTLSHDVNNDAVMDAVWPLIANKDAIAVNQAWAGHSGTPYEEADHNVTLNFMAFGSNTNVTLPSWTFWHKPLGDGKVAVLLMNHDTTKQSLTLTFARVPSLECSSCAIRDVWRRRKMGSFRDSFTIIVESHDSAFLVLSPSSQILL